MSETTRTDLHRSLPYAAHLTLIFAHFGVSFENEQAQSIPKENIYNLKHIQKFMGFRIEGEQVRRGSDIVEAPVVPEEVDPPPAVHCPAHDQAKQPLNEVEAPIPLDVPQDISLSPTLHTSSPQIPNVDPPSFSPQFQGPASTFPGGPFVPPELYSFLNDKFDTLNSSIHQMSESFELRIQSVSTQAQVVSTLDPVPRGPVCQSGTVCRHSLK
ncbi:hypothetical protein Taro_048518 [Colocasia esculenta]|uniref:Uncharacterized protein n=1 Tax=Colocasia esculenta TaxID=4460 RepID=A0A843X8B8_COLES|nr:hypothetical protein [Colocasia esculenta]